MYLNEKLKGCEECFKKVETMTKTLNEIIEKDISSLDEIRYEELKYRIPVMKKLCEEKNQEKLQKYFDDRKELFEIKGKGFHYPVIQSFEELSEEDRKYLDTTLYNLPVFYNGEDKKLEKLLTEEIVKKLCRNKVILVSYRWEVDCDSDCEIGENPWITMTQEDYENALEYFKSNGKRGNLAVKSAHCYYCGAEVSIDSIDDLRNYDARDILREV